jgi:hypothetical protein
MTLTKKQREQRSKCPYVQRNGNLGYQCYHLINQAGTSHTPIKCDGQCFMMRGGKLRMY